MANEKPVTTCRESVLFPSVIPSHGNLPENFSCRFVDVVKEEKLLTVPLKRAIVFQNIQHAIHLTADEYP